MLIFSTNIRSFFLGPLQPANWLQTWDQAPTCNCFQACQNLLWQFPNWAQVASKQPNQTRVPTLDEQEAWAPPTFRLKPTNYSQSWHIWDQGQLTCQASCIKRCQQDQAQHIFKAKTWSSNAQNPPLRNILFFPATRDATAHWPYGPLWTIIPLNITCRQDCIIIEAIYQISREHHLEARLHHHRNNWPNLFLPTSYFSFLFFTFLTATSHGPVPEPITQQIINFSLSSCLWLCDFFFSVAEGVVNLRAATSPSFIQGIQACQHHTNNVTDWEVTPDS